MFSTENLKVILVTGIILIVLWFVGEAMFGLMSDLYHFLDNYIYAFFAGIIAFFLAIWLVFVMFQITVVTVALILGGIGFLLGMFD